MRIPFAVLGIAALGVSAFVAPAAIQDLPALEDVAVHLYLEKSRNCRPT